MNEVKPTSLTNPCLPLLTAEVWNSMVEAWFSRNDRDDKPKSGATPYPFPDDPEDPAPGTVAYRVAHGERPPRVPMERILCR